MLRTMCAAAVASAMLLGSQATAADYGTLKGKIVFKGEPPNLQPVVAKGDQVKNAEVCAKQPVPDESLVVGEDGGIANVFVYLRKAPDDIHPKLQDPPDEPAAFTQENCRFVPHALFVRAGQGVAVGSEDPIPHNTHTFPIFNDAANFLLPPKPPKPVVVPTPKRELLPVQVKCDIHPWMTAWWLILDHPYATVTNEKGEFAIENLPAGEHTLTIWQEKAGYLEKSWTVNVPADEPGQEPQVHTLDFTGKDFED